jgi:hypothetical protein
MQKIRHMLKSEDAQAAVVITGFFVMFTVLAIFFYSN